MKYLECWKLKITAHKLDYPNDAVAATVQPGRRMLKELHDRNPVVPAKTINALTLNSANAYLMCVMNERPKNWTRTHRQNSKKFSNVVFNQYQTRMNAAAWLDSLVLSWVCATFSMVPILSRIEFDAMNPISLNRQTKIVTCIAQLKGIIVSTEFKTNLLHFSLAHRTKVNNGNRQRKTKFREKTQAHF